MTLHLKSRGYPFRPRVLFSCFIVVGVGFPTVYYFRRGQSNETSEESSDKSEEFRHSLGRKSNISPERFENRERLL